MILSKLLKIEHSYSEEGYALHCFENYEYDDLVSSNTCIHEASCILEF